LNIDLDNLNENIVIDKSHFDMNCNSKHVTSTGDHSNILLNNTNKVFIDLTPSNSNIAKKPPKKVVYTINTNLSSANNSQSNTTINAKANAAGNNISRQAYNDLFYKKTKEFTKSIHSDAKKDDASYKKAKTQNTVKKFNAVFKPEASPKSSVSTANVFAFDKSESHSNSITTKHTPVIPTKKEYTCTKLIKIDCDNKILTTEHNSYDRSKSETKFKQRRKSNNFLIPVVNTNLYDDNANTTTTLHQSFKSETNSSETDRDSVKIKKLSDLRRDKKFLRQESTDSKQLPENDIHDQLNSIRMTLSIKEKKENQDING
jgi:hypothetical protein